MYSCVVFEFGSRLSFGKACGNLIFSDSYNFYNENFSKISTLTQNIGDVHFDEQGVWINSKAATQYTKINSNLFSPQTWTVEAKKTHGYNDWAARTSDYIFTVERREEETVVAVYNNFSEKIREKKIDRLRGYLIAYKSLIYARTRSGSIYCFNENLDEVWSLEKISEIKSNNLHVGLPIAFEKLIIMCVGQDKHNSTNEFEVSAYQHDTGKLVWQQFIESAPNSRVLKDNKLYVAAGNRFVKIDAVSGEIEINMDVNYTTFDGKAGCLSAITPVSQGLLCFNHQNHFVELRDHKAETVLQTIKLPETYSYHLSVAQPVIEHEGKLYFKLSHLVMGLNPMKSAVAVLQPDPAAAEYTEAILEARPPYNVESIKDVNGKNGFYVRMEGDNPDKIIRYAHIVLKELAFKSGKTWLIEFESRDMDNAGMMVLEINTKYLSENKSLSEWKDTFSVIKERVEDELSSNDVKAGDGESNFVIDLRVM